MFIDKSFDRLPFIIIKKILKFLINIPSDLIDTSNRLKEHFKLRYCNRCGEPKNNQYLTRYHLNCIKNYGLLKYQNKEKFIIKYVNFNYTFKEQKQKLIDYNKYIENDIFYQTKIIYREKQLKYIYDISKSKIKLKINLYNENIFCNEYLYITSQLYEYFPNLDEYRFKYINLNLLEKNNYKLIIRYVIMENIYSILYFKSKIINDDYLYNELSNIYPRTITRWISYYYIHRNVDKIIEYLKKYPENLVYVPEDILNIICTEYKYKIFNQYDNINLYCIFNLT